MTTTRRTLLFGGLAAAAQATALHAQEASLPPGTIRIIAGFAPGGSSDVLARLIAEDLRARLGRTVVVENRAGGGGIVAAMAVKAARPDGLTLLLGNIAVMVLSPLTTADATYDSARDFASIARLVDFPIGMAVSAHVPVRTLAEFAPWAARQGREISAGNPATGSLPHIVGLMVGRALNVPIAGVTYRGGMPMVTDLVAGHIPLGFGAAPDLIPQHRAGAIRVLAVSGAVRSAALPDVPTFAESGVPGIEATGWSGLFAPAGTPQPIVSAYTDLLRGFLAKAETRERLESLAFGVTFADHDALRRQIIAETTLFGPLVREAVGR
jgi:tripartite-type tricarboxylate transporter receptor subunit TctC